MGGLGMTLSWGLARKTVESWQNEAARLGKQISP